MQSILETLLPLRMAAVIHIAGTTRPAVTRSLFSDWIILLTYRESVSRDRDTARSHDVTHVNRMSITQNLPDHPHSYAFQQTFCAIFKHLYLRYFSTNLFTVFSI